MPNLQLTTQEDIEIYMTPRYGETKLGQVVQLPGENWVEELPINDEIKFVVLNIAEDIGIRANEGLGGAQNNWGPFLKSFLNIQNTPQLNGNHFLILGKIDCSDLYKQLSHHPEKEALREAVVEIDNYVYPIIAQIIKSNKIPIVIGGGHNNAFPLIKGLAKAHVKRINVVNFDAHADFRPLEGRHSGNPFSYAAKAGLLEKYAIIGLQEAYNNHLMMSQLTKHEGVLYILWEDIFLREQIPFNIGISAALGHVRNHPFGVELDMDTIAYTLSSAMTPVGLTPVQAMYYLYTSALEPNASYLHLPEAIASERSDGLKDANVAKLLSYFVQAFCKGVLERKKTKTYYQTI